MIDDDVRAHSLARVACALACLFGVASGVSGADSQPELDRKLLAAETRYQSGELQSAETLLTQLLATVDAPGTAQAPGATQAAGPARVRRRCLFLLADLHRRQQRHKDALRFGLLFREELRRMQGEDVRDLWITNAIGLAEDHLAEHDTPAAQAILTSLLAARNPPLPAVPRLQVLLLSAMVTEQQLGKPQAAPAWRAGLALGQDLLGKYKQVLSPAEQVSIGEQVILCCRGLDDGKQSEAALKQLLELSRRLPDAKAKQREILARLAAQSLLSRDFPAAETYYRQALERLDLPAEQYVQAQLLLGLANVHQEQGDSAAARLDLLRAAKAIEGLLDTPATKTDAAASLNRPIYLRDLRALYERLEDPAKALRFAAQLHDLDQRQHGTEDPATITSLAALGRLHGLAGQYDKARPMLAEVVAYWEKRDAPPKLAAALNNLAAVERGVGDNAAAALLFEKALKIREKFLTEDDPDLAVSYHNLASVVAATGDYARAMDLYNKVLAMCKRQGARADGLLDTTLLNVSVAYKSQGRTDLALQYCLQSLELHQKRVDPDSLGVVAHYNTLSSLARSSGKLPDAYVYAAKVLEICNKHKQGRSAAAALANYNLGLVALRANAKPMADKHFQEALTLFDELGQRAMKARVQNQLGLVAFQDGRLQEAEKLFEAGLGGQGSNAPPQEQYSALCNLAAVRHKLGRTADALKLLDEAVKLTDAPRAGIIGAERERAEFYARFGTAFELLVDWNLEAKLPDAAFLAAEKSRSRTFLDQLQLAGVNLLDKLEGEEGAKLRASEQDLRHRRSSLRAELALTQDQARGRRLTKDLQALEAKYVDVWREVRNSSPAYRSLLQSGQDLWSLDRIRQDLLHADDLVLFYCLAAERSYVLAIGNGKADVTVFPLRIEELHREPLKLILARAGDPAQGFLGRGVIGTITSPKGAPVELESITAPLSGPLTRSNAKGLVAGYLIALQNRTVDAARGIIGTVTSNKGAAKKDAPAESAPKSGAQPASLESADASGVTALGDVLLPQALRDLIRKRAPRHLIIIPDGPLHSMPFEALLLRTDKGPQFALDELPPISYAPSVNILATLTNRSAAVAGSPHKVLTIGNPAYSQPKAAAPSAKPGAAADAPAAFMAVLPQLPGTGVECKRIADQFEKRGWPVTMLVGREANERQFLKAVKGCEFIHLAAHGLVDGDYENLFGGIALSPETGDDGMLSYGEILSLPLSGCELAVLSACQTNIGPERPLEAATSLAQAFLTAGARRVIASHWNVADESTAELMSIFFDELVKPSADGRPRDYAGALHAARRKIRRDPRWEAPFYWAPFVLVGPAEAARPGAVAAAPASPQTPKAGE